MVITSIKKITNKVSSFKYILKVDHIYRFNTSVVTNGTSIVLYTLYVSDILNTFREFEDDGHKNNIDIQHFKDIIVKY